MSNFSIKNYIFILKNCIRGSSLLRILQNIDIKKNVFISGNCLDLGSKNSKPSYHKFLNISEDTKITYTDLYSNEDGILSFDFNKRFPINDNEYDNILIFNVLEHVYNTPNILSESFRVLNKNGKLYGAVPFLYKYHEDPDDYWRFSHTLLFKLLKNQGFKKIKIIKQGNSNIMVLAHNFSYILRFKILIAITWSFCFLFDYILKNLLRRKNDHNNYLGLYFEAKK